MHLCTVSEWFSVCMPGEIGSSFTTNTAKADNSKYFYKFFIYIKWREKRFGFVSVVRQEAQLSQRDCATRSVGLLSTVVPLHEKNRI